MNKKELRKNLIGRRRAMDKSYKLNSDEMIYNNLTALPELSAAETVLTYISTEIEVDTIRLINYLLENGKTVAVPRCEGKNMRFIKICGFDSLIKGAYDIPEPVGDDEVTDFSGTVCITPALSYNEKGYRLGYGGGYYDRFGKKYNGITIGICYEDFVGEIPSEEHDQPVKILVTDKETRYF